jgi:hypothetical protein
VIYAQHWKTVSARSKKAVAVIRKFPVSNLQRISPNLRGSASAPLKYRTPIKTGSLWMTIGFMALLQPIICAPAATAIR